jgi:DNA-directed RNA polymerase III subunit RPC3
VLVQQHLALHYTAEDEETTYYEANWHHAYSLIRAGKIVQVLEDKYGEEIGTLASNLLVLGHTKINDLADAYGLRTKKKTNAALEEEHVNGNTPDTGLINGESSGEGRSKHIQNLPQLHSKLRRLLSSGYIIPVQMRDFYPSGDNINEASLELMRNKYPDGARGPKKQAAFRDDLYALMRERRDENGQGRKTFTTLKRGLNSHRPHEKSTKRRKLNGNHAKPAFMNGIASDSDSDDFDTESIGLTLDVSLSALPARQGLMLNHS